MNAFEYAAPTTKEQAVVCWKANGEKQKSWLAALIC